MTVQQLAVSVSHRYLSPWNPYLEPHKTPDLQVVTIFLQRGDKFLVLQRAKKDAQYGLWGIPGGKLDQGERPLDGLLREIAEETTIVLSRQSCHLLGTTISQTTSDGRYGLYLYHAMAPQQLNIQISQAEHHEYRWVTLEEFQMLDLLFAQREAFHLVEHNLKKVAFGGTNVQ